MILGFSKVLCTFISHARWGRRFNSMQYLGQCAFIQGDEELQLVYTDTSALQLCVPAREMPMQPVYSPRSFAVPERSEMCND